jgi:hypothetical protein
MTVGWCARAVAQLPNHYPNLLRPIPRTLLSPGVKTIRTRPASEEHTICRYGIVESPRIPAVFAVEARVKGDILAALRTALRRLAKHIGGYRGGAISLCAGLPIAQREDASD